MFAVLPCCRWRLACGAQQPTFRAGVTLVSTDVIPRDGSGRFVADLTKDNFTVLEDGQPQTIVSFALVQGGRTYNLLAPPPAPAAAPEGIVLPPSKPRAVPAEGRVVLIFIDDLHFEPELSPHVRRVMQTIGDTLLHDGDLITVLSSGPSFIEIGPTYDKKTAMEAVGKIRGSGTIPSEIFKMLESSQGPGDIRHRAQMAFYTAYRILDRARTGDQSPQGRDLREQRLRPRSVHRGPLQPRSHPGRPVLGADAVSDRSGESVLQDAARSPPTSICTG